MNEIKKERKKERKKVRKKDREIERKKKRENERLRYIQRIYVFRRTYLNGSRLLFSLLKKNDPEVQAMAAWASCRLLESAASAEGMILNVLEEYENT